MKKALILGVLAIGIVVFAYVWLFMPSESETSRAVDDARSAANAENDVDVTVPTVPESGVGSLESLRALGMDIECAIVYQTAEYEDPIEGTYFVSEGNIRGDFLTPSPDLSGQMLSSLIIADSMMYVWSEIEGQSYGMKMDLTMFDEAEVEKNEPVSLDADVEYSCKAWQNVDRTVFLPPGDVLFQDFGAMMRSGMEYGTIYEEGDAIVPEY